MNKKYIYGAVFVLAFIFLILPYMGVIYYTLPRNDEFACAYGITVGGGYSVSTLLKFVASNYLEWEGNYSGVFIYSALNPIIIGNSDSTVHIMNILCFMGFLFGWSYIIYRCISFFDIGKNRKYILTFTVFVISLNCRFMRETLGWYTGYMYYTIQLLLGMLGLFMVYDLINHEGNNKTKKKTIFLMCVACIFEVIGAGGTLHVSAILCWVILLLLVWAIYRKKEWIKAAILFGAILLATITNVAAPGHRVRKDGYEPVSLVQGIAYTVSCVYNEMKRLFTSTYIPYIFLCIFIALFYIIRKSRKLVELHPVLVGFCGIACIVGSSFPVCYGYGKATMAPRGYETMDLMIVIWSVLFLCSVVNFLKLHDIQLSRSSVTAMVTMMLLMISTVAISNVEISNIPVLQCISGLANGSIKDYSDYWRNVLHEVESSPQKDLVIDVNGEYLDRECIIDRVMIQEDANNWVNTSMSVYYGHDTVRIRRVD